MVGDASRAGKLSVMVVDDDAFFRESLCLWLAEEGHQVVAVEGAHQALAAAAKQRIDLAFLDLKMPGTGGLELQSKLAGLHPDIDVVLMTAYPSLDLGLLAMKAGAVDFVVKPFDPARAMECIRG